MKVLDEMGQAALLPAFARFTECRHLQRHFRRNPRTIETPNRPPGIYSLFFRSFPLHTPWQNTLESP